MEAAKGIPKAKNRRLSDVVAERFKTLREECGISQREAARKLGFSAFGAVRDWEQGVKVPNAANIAKVCRTFNVSADWLLGLTDEREGRP